MSSYFYETHLHTAPVSKCASANVKETLEFYKSLGYDGVFITNHFIDGNISCDPSLAYEDKINFYFSDYELACALGPSVGIKIFLGVEMSYYGTDFLVYGLDKSWFLAHPEIEHLSLRDKLTLYARAGALIIQAHPFREAAYIECIRLLPRHVQGVEIYNACRTDHENAMAALYAERYELLPFAGSDNHGASKQGKLGGMCSALPLLDEADFIAKVRSGEMTPFQRRNC